MWVRLLRKSSYGTNWSLFMLLCSIALIGVAVVMLHQEIQLKDIRSTLLQLELEMDEQYVAISFDETEWMLRQEHQELGQFFSQAEHANVLRSDVLFWLEEHQPKGMSLSLLSVAEDGLIYLNGSCDGVFDYALLLQNVRESSVYLVHKYAPLVHQTYGGYSFSVQLQRISEPLLPRQVQS